MVKNNKKTNWGKYIFWLLIIMFITYGWFILPKMLNNLEKSYSTPEPRNYCNSIGSCFCRDKCEDLYGHSEWESWIYNNKKECWCIEENFTKRIF